jgi:hypothetical protein
MSMISEVTVSENNHQDFKSDKKPVPPPRYRKSLKKSSISPKKDVSNGQPYRLEPAVHIA